MYRNPIQNLELPGLYKLSKKDLTNAGEICGRAYFPSEIFAWLMSSPEDRKKYIGKIYATRMKINLKDGAVFATSHNLECVGSIISSEAPFSLRKKYYYVKMGLQMGKEIFNKFMKFAGAISEIEESSISGDFMHLTAVATDPEFHKQGYLRKFLTPVLEYLDQQQLRCYIEVQGEPNASIYKKFGFRVISEDTIMGGQIKFWPMVRDPVSV